TRSRFIFKNAFVAEKITASLSCYKPEALSVACTPMSPKHTSGDFSMAGNLMFKSAVPLPFHEIESCTASKQEHTTSINLREINVGLLKSSSDSDPLDIQAVASKYVSNQMEASRYLCYCISVWCGIRLGKNAEK